MGTSANDIDIGVGVHTNSGSQAAVDVLVAKLAALRQELAQVTAAQNAVAGGGTLAGATAGATNAAAAINQTIGAFTKLGQAVDVANAKAVTAFRQEADAVSVYLARLGATEAEINRVGAAAARLEQRAGASRFAAPIAGVGATAQRAPTLPIIPRVPEETISSFDRVAPRLRTAANGVALLAIAAETGRGSLQSMATAAGNVAIGVGFLLTGPVGGLVVALGAIVTLVTTAIGLWKEAHTQLDATGKAQEEAAAARIERLAGEDAAQAQSIQKQAAAEIRAVNDAKGTEKQKADAIVAINAARDEKLATLEKNRRQKALDNFRTQGNELAALQDKLFLNEEQQAREEIQRRFDTQLAEINRQRALAQNDPDAARRQQRVDDLKRQEDTLNRRRRVEDAQVTKDTTAARIAAERNANATLLELTGQTSAAQTIRIEQQFDDLVKNLIAKGVANARAVAQSILNAEAAKVALDSIERQVTQTFARSDNAIARTNALLGAHQITLAQARERIVSALSAERDAVAASIPLLQQQADALGGAGNPEVLAKLDAAKTKLLELSIQVQRASDVFAELKDTARESATAAIAGFLEGATKLGTESHAEMNALSADILSAQQELNELLAIPAERRSGETNKRISDLRAEIESTSVSLDNAKSSITTWRDLFVSALQSIADALVRVSSQMLATALIERLLGLAVGAAVDPTDAIIAKGVPGVSVIGGHARGGIIRGPGTGTSDSILGWVSNGEGILTERAVQLVGEPFVHALNALAAGSTFAPAQLPSRIPRFNAGGVVDVAGIAGLDGGTTRLDLHVHDSNDHIVRVVDRRMESPAGRDIVITHVRKNGRQLSGG